MKKVSVLILFMSCFISCKKKNDIVPNNNEVKATVIVSPTSTITINAKGSKTWMGTASFSGTVIQGTNEANAAVYINVFSGVAFLPVTIPGTYSIRCEYRTNVASQNTPIYSNSGTNAGSITFTTINGQFMEGFFNTVCRCFSPGCAYGVDSVIVSGTFKGDYLQ